MARKLALVLLLTFAFAGAARSQSTEFTYQGRLLFGDAPASGNYDFVFSLFDAATGGNQVGQSVTLTAVGVVNGVFSVRIDFGNQFPGASRFLQIQVRQSGTVTFATLSPLQAISSAPYSIKSLNADSATTATNSVLLGGLKAGNYVLASDPRLSDSRPPSAGSANYIQNGTTQQPLSSFNIDGTGSATVLNATTSFNIGTNPVLSVLGESTFVGIGAGQNNSVSTSTFVGFQAGQNNTSGGRNSFFGPHAGATNTTGASNSFFGMLGGFNNTTGGQNSFFGDSSGFNNVLGQNNTFIGYQSGTSNTGGSENTFLGTTTGAANTIGFANTLVGRSANLGSGHNEFSTAIGAFATVSLNDSVMIGKPAGIYFGATRPADTVQTSGNMIVGSDATVRGNSAVQGNASIGGTLSTTGGASIGASALIGGNLSALGNVGIGVSTPAATLHIRTNAGNVLFGGAGCNSGFAGMGFGPTLSGCSNYSLLGNGTDTIINRPTGGAIHFREANGTQMAIATGGFVGIGTTTPTAPLTIFNANTACLDILTSSSANPSFGFSQLVRGDGAWLLNTSSGATRMIVDGSGFVGIGTATPNPSARLTVSGGIFTNGTLSLTPVSGGTTSLCMLGNQIATCGSSVRYKTDVVGFGSGLDLIKRLRPVTFRWRSDNARDLGLVAEEVKAVEPLLTTNTNGKVEGVKYDRVAVVLVNAVNEQQTQIENQQKQIDDQRETIKRQQAELESLRQIVCAQNPSEDLCRHRK